MDTSTIYKAINHYNQALAKTYQHYTPLIATIKCGKNSTSNSSFKKDLIALNELRSLSMGEEDGYLF